MRPTALALLASLLLPAAAAAEAAPGPAVEEAPGVPLVDLHDPEDNARWRMVNDDVMGGRSIGGVSFEGGVMTFSGSINTDGGGFSSVRRPLPEGALKGMDRVFLRVRAVDDRPYRVNFRDGAGGGRRDGRSVLHRFDLPITEPGAWETVEVRFADLVPSVRGDPRPGLPRFEPGEAVEMGFILNDTGDGPFELQVSGVWVAPDPG